MPGGAAVGGDHATRSGRMRALQRPSSADGIFRLRKLSFDHHFPRPCGVVLLALFSLNNSNSPNSQGNPLHLEPCKLRLTHTLKLYL